MSHHTLNLNENLYQYMLSISLREHPVQKELRERTARMSESQMQISPEQGQFMGLLVELMGAKKTMEIGVYTGYSALSVALALPEDGKVLALDINESWTNVGKPFWKKANVEHKIDLRLGPALEALDKLIANNNAAEQYDLIFIDADKKNYLQYYEKSLALLRKGGIILIDNVLWSGAVANPDFTDTETVAIRHLNHRVHYDERVSLSLLPIGDGLSLIRKR